MRTTKTPWGRTRVLAEPFGLDRTRQMNKMARHKQCLKLGGSRNADLSAPQEVTPQTLYIDNTTELLQREGGWETKLL